MVATNEALQEAVVRLEQALGAERRHRAEAEALVAGLRAIAAAPTFAATDAALLVYLQTLLGFSAGALLVRDADGLLRERASTDPRLVGLTLAPGPLLTRVLAGQPAAIFDLERAHDLAPLAAIPGLRSAVCLGLTTSNRTALLLGAHPQPAAFSPRHTALARSFAQVAAPVLDSFAAREDAQHRHLAEARAKSLELKNVALREQLDTIVRQQAQIQRLSAPILSVWQGVVMVPIVGTMDDDQIDGLSERLLKAVCDQRARVAILDLTGLDAVDAATVERLRAIIRAVRLLGARCYITGIRPALAVALAEHDARGIVSFGTLADGLAAALAGPALGRIVGEEQIDLERAHVGLRTSRKEP
jgi:rsbT co-antagonist protein RsbR